MGTAPASAREALDMVRAGLGYLAAADATQLSAATQAECLRELEQDAAVATAARASMLAGFTAGQGYAGDADYSAVSWLMHRTGITRGAAVGHAAWARRAGTHPKVVAALAAEQVSESVGRLICLWTAKLPEQHRDDADEVLLAAAASGLALEELAALFAEMYERSRSELPDEDPGRDFAGRGLKLATTFGGAGVIHGDLTPECAEMVGRVLDALGAPAGADDDRTRDQRYHDALAEAMRRLMAAGLLPERAGQPVKAWVHISLADLLLLDAGSALQDQWTAQVRERWAAHRAKASETGASDGAWLDGDAAEAIACDASTWTRWRIWSGCAWSWTGGGTAGGTRPGPRWSKPSSARPSTFCLAPADWPASCAAVSSAPASAGPACRWTSATPRRSRPGSATRCCCGTGTASGPAAATSPPAPARCTIRSTRPTAARRR